MEESKNYNLKTETGKFSLNGGSVELKVKRGELAFNWFLVAYNILLTIWVGVACSIPNIGFLLRITIIVLGSFILFKFCLFNDWFRNKVVGVFSKSMGKEEVSKH